MLSNRWDHEDSFNDNDSYERSDESPCCHKNIANLSPWTVSMAQKT